MHLRSVPPIGDPLERLAPWHLVGIGGAGMSALAWRLLERGLPVSGSDRADGDAVRALAAAGVAISIGHDAEAIPGEGSIVASSAIRGSNPELVAAAKRGLPVLHRAQLLRLLAGDLPTIAVTGTHGKTTTTAMVAHLMRVAGVDPLVVVGGAMLAAEPVIPHASELGRWAVVEADESDGSSCWLTPDIAVVTNLDAEHLDHYRDLDEIVETTATFAAGLRRGGTLVAPSDLATRLRPRPDVRVRTTDRDAIVAPDALVLDGIRYPWRFRAMLDSEHNRRNAAAAIVATVAAGLEPSHAVEAIATFGGTRRRFELRGIAGGVRVVDDYAHHPTEIAAALAAARDHAAPPARVIAIFEPHLYSRTKHLGSELGRALAAADDVGVLPVYGAREAEMPGVSSRIVLDAALDAIGHRGEDVAISLADRDAAVEFAADRARPGDLVVLLGAGPVTELAAPILIALETRSRR